LFGSTLAPGISATCAGCGRGGFTADRKILPLLRLDIHHKEAAAAPEVSRTSTKVYLNRRRMARLAVKLRLSAAPDSKMCN